MISNAAIFCIALYQKYISPIKGFSCAYRISTGEIGCSGYGKKVITRFGLIKGIKLLNRRFEDCSWHANHLRAEAKNLAGSESYIGYKEQYAQFAKLSKQSGAIDCGAADCGDLSCNKAGFDFTDCIPTECCTDHYKPTKNPEKLKARELRNKIKHNKHKE